MKIAAALEYLFGDTPRQHEIAMFAEIVEAEVARVVALHIDRGIETALTEKLLALTPVERAAIAKSRRGLDLYMKGRKS